MSNARSPWFPSVYPVVHIARRFGSTEVDPDTGNEYLVPAAPVVRYVQEIAQKGKGSSADVLSGDFQGRVEESLIMSVDNPEVYESEDQVIINPEILNGEYVPDTGTAYWVNGTPADQRQGPFWTTRSRLFDGFGGVVHLRRVT